MIKHWIKAFRLRTLPLSFSAIIMGNAIAKSLNIFDWSIFIATLLTTLFLQVLSNLANDYGDGIKGTDNADRLGPERALQSGAISPKQMKTAIIINVILAFCSGIYLIVFAVDFSLNLILFFIGLGVLAIISAIMYTVGKKAYGYNGLGDLFVFIFFGIVGVGGAYFLQTNYFDWHILLPAIAIGLLSSAVLNLNNMRDIENDAKMNKNTLVVKIGLPKSKIYHYLLFILSYIVLFLYIFLEINQQKWVIILFTIAIATIHITHILRVKKASSYQAFDPELKIIALSTFLLSFGWLLYFSYFS